jgi:hypothetical protein
VRPSPRGNPPSQWPLDEAHRLNSQALAPRYREETSVHRSEESLPSARRLPRVGQDALRKRELTPRTERATQFEASLHAHADQ